MSAMINYLESCCTDWDGTPMLDGEEPRIIPSVGKLREIVKLLKNQTEYGQDTRPMFDSYGQYIGEQSGW